MWNAAEFGDSSEQVGPDWHHLLLWSLAFYCGEHFAELSFKSGSVVDYVVQSALNAVLDPSKMPTELQLHVLRVSGPSWIASVKKVKQISDLDRNRHLSPSCQRCLFW